MPDDLSPLLSWTFISETGFPKDVDKMLIDGEHAVAAYRTLRDVAIFTDKRIIVRDSQGLTGTKTEIYTLPYSSINMYSSENAGIIDFNAELELWTRAGHITINLKKGVDIRKLDRLIATGMLRKH